MVRIIGYLWYVARVRSNLKAADVPTWCRLCSYKGSRLDGVTTCWRGPGACKPRKQPGNKTLIICRLEVKKNVFCRTFTQG